MRISIYKRWREGRRSSRRDGMGRRGSRKEEITHGWLKKENNNDKKAWTGMLKRDNN